MTAMSRISIVLHNWWLLLGTILSIPIFFQIIWMLHIQMQATKLLNRQDVELAAINRTVDNSANAPKIKIVGVVGDIFEPNLNNKFRAYDAILISAVIEPYYQKDNWEIIESHSLLRSLISYIRDDPASLPMLEKIWGRLNKLVKNDDISSVCQASVPADDDIRKRSGRQFIYERCYPFITDTIPGSRLQQKGVHKVATLPLFLSRRADATAGEKEMLGDNVRKNVAATLLELSKDQGIKGVAIPALAGTQFRGDSGYFLTYKESFRQAFKGTLEWARISANGTNIIYFVVWNRLIGNEAEAAVEGLVNLTASDQAGFLLVLATMATMAVAFFLFFLRDQIIKKALREAFAIASLRIIVFSMAEIGSFFWLSTKVNEIGDRIWDIGGFQLFFLVNILTGGLASLLSYAIVVLGRKQ